MRSIVLTAIAGVCLAACTPRVQSADTDTAQDMVEKLTYTKDSRSGLCFGVASSGRFDNPADATIVIENVPCEAVEHLIRP